MSIAERLFSTETRAHPRDPVVASWWGSSNNTSSGVSVTAETAMRNTAVFCACRVLSEGVASLPLDILKRLPGGGKEKALQLPLYKTLHDQPNRWQTSFEWREMMQGHLVMRGNAYSEIIPTSINPVSELVPLHPDRVTPFWAPDRSIAYGYQPEDGPSRTILQEEMFHLRGLSSDLLGGLSVIDHGKEAIGLGLAAEEFGGRFFGNGTTLGGVLTHPLKLGDDAYERLKVSWAERHQGANKSHNPAILEEGMKWQSLGIPPDQAQFLETRKFQVTEIARLFRVPAHMLVDLEHATFTNIEHQGLEYVIHTLMPWLIRWEQAIKRDLFTENAKKMYTAKHKVQSLLRGDSEARGKYYGSLFQVGALSPNQILEFEDMNPVEGGDQRFVPMNMRPLDEPFQDEEKDKDKEDDEDKDELNMKVVMATRNIFRQAFDKIVSCQARTLSRYLSEDMAGFEVKAVAFVKGHNVFVERALTPVIDTILESLAAMGVDTEQKDFTGKITTRIVLKLLKGLNSLSSQEHVSQYIASIEAESQDNADAEFNNLILTMLGAHNGNRKTIPSN